MPEVHIALTTAPSLKVATAIAEQLVEESLVACANILPPMTSIYRWNDQIEKESEVQLILKTSRVDALKSRLLELHPYNTPEFLVIIPSGGSEAYLEWVRKSCRAVP